MIGLVTLLLACGGAEQDSAEGAAAAIPQECTVAFEACGGDPTGSWVLAGVCDPGLDPADIGCEDATWEVTEDRSTGSVQLNADGSYERVYALDVDIQAQIPKSCLLGLGCDTLVAFSAGLITSCVDADDFCDCDGTFAAANTTDGTWTVDGNAVVTNDDSRTRFCVDGDQADTVDDQDIRALWTR